MRAETTDEMTRWRVRLFGDDSSMQKARELIADGCKIERYDDGYFHLSAADFESLDDGHDVNALAERIVKAINASLSLYTSESEIRHNAVREYDKDGARLSSVVYGSVAIGARTCVTAILEESSPERGRRLVRQFLANPDVREAYGYLDEDAFDLWKAYEIIEHDMRRSGYESFTEAATCMGWATDAELRAFEGSVNSPEVLGDRARHARSDRAAPAQPMSLGQARQFIKRLLDRWTEYLDSQGR